VRTLIIEAVTHGRVLVDDAAGPTAPWLVTFHGYGQSADQALEAARAIPGADRWRLAAVQALHPFYARDNRTVIASWMTRQERELAITDNVEYVNRALEALGAGAPVFLGFSQGVAMAYRAALLGRHGASGVIALGGDIPPELRDRAELTWPPVLIGVGDADDWYAAKVSLDEAFLRKRAIPHTVIRYHGGHAWTDEFREAAAAWLQARKAAS